MYSEQLAHLATMPEDQRNQFRQKERNPMIVRDKMVIRRYKEVKCGERFAFTRQAVITYKKLSERFAACETDGIQYRVNQSRLVWVERG